MMQRYEVRLSGSGGQGLLLAGIIMAEAAILEGKNAVDFPYRSMSILPFNRRSFYEIIKSAVRFTEYWQSCPKAICTNWLLCVDITHRLLDKAEAVFVTI